MPRNRPKKGKPYREEDLNMAMEEVKQCIEEGKKFSQRAIGRKYNINKDVLSRHLKGEASGVAGRPTAIAPAEEQELADSLKTMSKWGFGLLKEEIKDVIQEYVVENKIKNPFKNNRPGDDWFLAFRERHNLTVKKPEALEVTRRTITSDPFIIFEFYKLLASEIKKLGLETKPGCIYNLDESGFQMDPSKTKVVTEKGQPAHRVIQGSGRENTTVLACVNAEGKSLPPLVLFEANKFWSTWIGEEGKGMIKGTFFGVSPTGWMTSLVFHQWFAIFVNQVTERPILLLFDGHLSHLDIKTIELARSNKITILKFPPHTTDLLQPLDRGVFGPLKTAWDREIHIYQREFQQKLTKADFVNVLGKVWLTGLSEKNITAGFRKTGIFPTDPTKYPEDRFDPIKLKRYKEMFPASLATTNKDNPNEDVIRENQDQSEPKNQGLNLAASDDQGSVGSSTQLSVVIESDILAIPSTSSADSETTLLITPKRSFEELLLKKISPKPTTSKVKRRKVDTEAVVITSDSYAEKIKQQDEEKRKEKGKKEARRKAREEKKKKKEEVKCLKSVKKSKSIMKQKKINNSSSEESLSDLLVEDMCQEVSDNSVHFSDSSEDELIVIKSKTFKVPSSLRQLQLHVQRVKEHIEIMQVYAVYFESSFYLGQVQKVFYNSEDESPNNISEVEMKYLKWCGDDKYKWPTKEEIAIVKIVFVFDGPIKTESFDPFIVPNIEDIRSIYKNFKKFREQLLNEDLSETK